MFSDLIPLIGFFVSGGYAGYVKNQYKMNLPNASPLNVTEKTIVIITEIFVPIIAGAIYYFYWKKPLPTKSQQANKYSWIIFLIELLLGAVLVITGVIEVAEA